jgi:hypothetical protein
MKHDFLSQKTILHSQLKKKILPQKTILHSQLKFFFQMTGPKVLNHYTPNTMSHPPNVRI